MDLLLYEIICLFDAFTEGAVFDKFANFRTFMDTLNSEFDREGCDMAYRNTEDF